jgi:guanylate kinase
MLLTLTGASGTGKTTIARLILAADSRDRMIPSCTDTRKPRETDLPEEYAHISSESFDRAVHQGWFAWTAAAHGNRFGTLFNDLNRAVRSPHLGILILTPQAVNVLVALLTSCGEDLGLHRAVFIRTPDAAVIQTRLRARERDNPEAERFIAARLKECASWEDEAKASGVNYFFIRNEGNSPLSPAANIVDWCYPQKNR